MRGWFFGRPAGNPISAREKMALEMAQIQAYQQLASIGRGFPNDYGLAFEEAARKREKAQRDRMSARRKVSRKAGYRPSRPA